MCMATKTISIDIEAYACLTHARTSPHESFSKVIERPRWRQAVMQSLPPLSEERLRRLDEAQAADLPPEDAWKTV